MTTTNTGTGFHFYLCRHIFSEYIDSLLRHQYRRGTGGAMRWYGIESVPVTTRGRHSGGGMPVYPQGYQNAS